MSMTLVNVFIHLNPPVIPITGVVANPDSAPKSRAAIKEQFSAEQKAKEPYYHEVYNAVLMELGANADCQLMSGVNQIFCKAVNSEDIQKLKDIDGVRDVVEADDNIAHIMGK